MITVHLPTDLADKFRADAVLIVSSQNLASLVHHLDSRYPGMGAWLSEADGRVRQHLSVFVNGYRVKPRAPASTPLPKEGDVWILRAISGG